MSDATIPARPSPSEWRLFLALVDVGGPILLGRLLARLPDERRPTVRAGRKLLDRLCEKGWVERIEADRRRPSGHLLCVAARPVEYAVRAEWEHLLGERLREHAGALDALRALVRGWLHEYPEPYETLTESRQAAADTVHEKPEPKR